MSPRDNDRLSGLRATELPLHLSLNLQDDWLECIEFGSVSDGKPESHLVYATEEFRYVLRSPRGPIIGFEARGIRSFDPESLGEDAWGEPRFHVPAVGLSKGSVGEIVLAAKAQFELSTADVCFFLLALAAAEDEGDLESAAGHWMSCLEAGDMKGHFGLGYTLFDLNRHREAYKHLRRYSELAPHNSWAWLWLGRAAEAIGEDEEAHAAYRRAIRRERVGSFSTDAKDRLADLERRRQRTS